MAVSTNLSRIMASEAAWQAFKEVEFISPSFCCQGTCWKECSSTAHVCQVWLSLKHGSPGNGTLCAKTECLITKHLPQQRYNLISLFTKSFIHDLETAFRRTHLDAKESQKIKIIFKLLSKLIYRLRTYLYVKYVLNPKGKQNPDVALHCSGWTWPRENGTS